MKTYQVAFEGFKVTFKIAVFSREQGRINDPDFVNERLQKHYKSYWTNRRLVNMVYHGRFSVSEVN